MNAESEERARARQFVDEYHGYVVDYAEHYLIPKGWFESVATRDAVDGSGPTPWMTYPALKMLETLIKKDHTVLEYGTGGSSLWFAERARTVVGVEHDLVWAQRVGRERPANHSLIYAPAGAAIDPVHAEFLEAEFFDRNLDPAPGPDVGRNARAGLLSREFSGYASQILRYPVEYFDVVVVDGMARVLTAWLAARRLRPTGFIVFDNSDRDEYAAGYRYLEEAGFCRIDFWGTGPINPYEWCTSIFTRTLAPFGVHAL